MCAQRFIYVKLEQRARKFLGRDSDAEDFGLKQESKTSDPTIASFKFPPATFLPCSRVRAGRAVNIDKANEREHC